MTAESLRVEVAEQARAVAAAWSPAGAPASWWLTAETFTAIAEEPVLLDLAVEVPTERLPPLLLSAAITRLVAELRPEPLASYYPHPGGPQPPRDEEFRPALCAFATAEREALRRLCAEHRYQMNEVGRCLDVLPALALVSAGDPRPLALVDLGTGAGLGLHVDRYRYDYELPDGGRLLAGEASSPVSLSCDVRAGRPPVGPHPPSIGSRVGVDSEPLDLTDPATSAWLAACVPPEASAVTRFAAAAAVAGAHPVRMVRGDVVDVLRRVVAELPRDELLCLVDTYVHVFLPPPELARFVALVHEIGRERDLDWISVDPLVPLGPQGCQTTQDLRVPPRALEATRAGVVGVVGHLSVRRDGTSDGEVLGLAHPGGAWLEWF